VRVPPPIGTRQVGRAHVEILLADDHAPVRRLVRNLLTTRDDWEVCAEAADGDEAVEKAKASHPDLAILDISMPRMNGIDAARQIVESRCETVVLMISMYDPGLVLDELRRAGVRGFVSKSRLHSELIPAIEALLEGRTYFEPQHAPSDLDAT
jgi:DNA-binding NarL/FixJ family response regulator